MRKVDPQVHVMGFEIYVLYIVMKLMACNGQPVAKLSDAVGKTLCTDETFLAYLRQVFHHSAS